MLSDNKFILETYTAPESLGRERAGTFSESQCQYRFSQDYNYPLQLLLLPKRCGQQNNFSGKQFLGETIFRFKKDFFPSLSQLMKTILGETISQRNNFSVNKFLAKSTSFWYSNNYSFSIILRCTIYSDESKGRPKGNGERPGVRRMSSIFD